jgi:peptidoglycan/LPS O-acetylase OafA/YrhL
MMAVARVCMLWLGEANSLASTRNHLVAMVSLFLSVCVCVCVCCVLCVVLIQTYDIVRVRQRACLCVCAAACVCGGVRVRTISAEREERVDGIFLYMFAGVLARQTE